MCEFVNESEESERKFYFEHIDEFISNALD
jgi:hypothetical protein